MVHVGASTDPTIGQIDAGPLRTAKLVLQTLSTRFNNLWPTTAAAVHTLCVRWGREMGVQTGSDLASPQTEGGPPGTVQIGSAPSGIGPTPDGRHIEFGGGLAGQQYAAPSPLPRFRPRRALEPDNTNPQRPAKKQAPASWMQLLKKYPVHADWRCNNSVHLVGCAVVLKTGGTRRLSGVLLRWGWGG